MMSVRSARPDLPCGPLQKSVSDAQRRGIITAARCATKPPKECPRRWGRTSANWSANAMASRASDGIEYASSAVAMRGLVLAPVVVGDHAIATSCQERADLGEVLLAARVAMDQEGIAASLGRLIQLDGERLPLDLDGSRHPIRRSECP